MPLASEAKKEIIAKFGASANDTGKAQVQIALLTQRIADLTTHFQANPKDHHSRQGLLKMVGQRRRLLNFLAKTDIAGYRELIKELGIRR